MAGLTRNPILVLKRRTELLLFCFLIAFLAVAARLVWVQGVMAAQYQEFARRMHRREIVQPARRGRILARDGQPLATNIPAYDLTANPRVVADKRATAEALARLIGGSADDYYARLTRATGYFCWLRRSLDEPLAERIRAHLGESLLAGVELRPSTRRVYPSGTLAANVLGDVDIDLLGRDGLEFRFNRDLAGEDGVVVADVDAAGQVIPQTERRVREPRHGHDLVTTLDPTIQQFAERELARIAEQYQPESAIAVVMDVRTREVLALANWPTFDPNSREKIPSELRRCRAVTDPFEPGSVFKILTAAAALEERIDTNAVCTGALVVGPHTINCDRGKRHGAVDLRTIIAKSCNIATGILAERLGPQRMWHHLQTFGFLDKTGIELGGEATGGLPKPENWRTINLVNIGFGQGIAVNAIQLCNLFATIGDDGRWKQPRLVTRVGDRALPERVPGRVAMSPTNAALLRDYMETTCTEGTGTAAKIAHYRVGGKTGTAQIAEGGRYLAGYHTASFGGLLPMTRPRLAILVAVRKPRGASYGGVVAAPAFREIARQCATYLQIPPDAPGDERDGRDPGSFYRWRARHGTTDGSH